MGDIEQILQTSWPILLMVVIFYFLLWRPQKKQQKERTNLLRQLEKRPKNCNYWWYLWRNYRT